MQHVLWLMWMAYPNQADSLQGFCSVNCTILAANDPGIGSGWQQSKQNWAQPAVVGHWARMRSSDLCCVQGAPLHPYCFFCNVCYSCSRIVSLCVFIAFTLFVVCCCPSDVWSSFRLTGLAPPPLPFCIASPRQLLCWIPFGDHPLKLERYRED